MLYALAAALVILWTIALVTDVMGSFTHVLIVAAVAVVLVRMLTTRRSL